MWLICGDLCGVQPNFESRTTAAVGQEYAVRNDNMECFLTYADNNAVGYFAKQGFTKEITFDRERVNPELLPALPPC